MLKSSGADKGLDRSSTECFGRCPCTALCGKEQQAGLEAPGHLHVAGKQRFLLSIDAYMPLQCRSQTMFMLLINRVVCSAWVLQVPLSVGHRSCCADGARCCQACCCHDMQSDSSTVTVLVIGCLQQTSRGKCRVPLLLFRTLMSAMLLSCCAGRRTDWASLALLVRHPGQSRHSIWQYR